jgi:hypothetical protein
VNVVSPTTQATALVQVPAVDPNDSVLSEAITSLGRVKRGRFLPSPWG